MLLSLFLGAASVSYKPFEIIPFKKKNKWLCIELFHNAHYKVFTRKVHHDEETDLKEEFGQVKSSELPQL